MSRPLPIAAAFLLLATVVALAVTGAPAPAGAAIGISPAREFAPRRVVVKFEGQREGRAVHLPRGIGVRRAAAALRQSPRVEYAAPDYVATASKQESLPPSGIPNDPGEIGSEPGLPGDWVSLQWNFLPWSGTATPLLPTSPGGIDAVAAWQHLIAAGRRGARGVTVAVLDTGVAYRNKLPHFRRSPDFTPGQFTKGYDFVANDPVPLDENGHGTHVAGTIAEKTNNGIGLTGLAYRAKLMPVRVLDRNGSGHADEIAKGIHYAVAHGADVINMSFNFGCGKGVPGIDEELRRAYRKGVVTVASIGNLGSEACVSPPATGPRVIGVGGSTEGGCLGVLLAERQGHRRGRAGRGRSGAGLPLCLEPADLPGDAERRQPPPLRRARQLRRDLDGGGARLRRGGDDPRLWRDPGRRLAPGQGQRRDPAAAQNGPVTGPAGDAAGRRPDRCRSSYGDLALDVAYVVRTMITLQGA